MTLTVTGAVREGASWLGSATGVVAVTGYALLALVGGGLVNGLAYRMMGSLALTLVPGPVAVGAPTPVLAVGAVAGLVALFLGSAAVLRLAADGRRDRLPDDLWTGLGWTAARLLVAGLIVGVVVTAGILLFLLPGLFLLTALIFYGFIIATGGGIFDGIRKSWELTAGHRLRVFVLVLLTMLWGSVLNGAATLTRYATVSALLHGIGVVGGLAVMGAAYRQLGGGRYGG